MSKLPYNITPNSASVLINGRFKIIPSSANNFQTLCAELRKPEHNIDEIMRLADVMNFVALKEFAGVQIGKDRVMWRGQQVKNVIAERLLTAVMEGYDPEPLSLFLDKLMQNPIKATQEELYLWLEAGNAPISPDGDFLAFKRVRDDYRDCHTGTMDNSVGKVVEMPRSDCDTNRNNHCSRGLHFCQHGYLQSFGGKRTMIVKVNPADVVSIPTDYNFQKGRTWRYEVVGEVDNDQNNTSQHFDRVIDDRYPSQQITGVIRDEAELSALFGDMTKVLTEHLGVEPSAVTLEARIADDLGADSLDSVELVMAFEERFAIEIGEEKAESLISSPLLEIRDQLYDLIKEANKLDRIGKKDEPFVIDTTSKISADSVKAVAQADMPMAESLNAAMSKKESSTKQSKRPIPKKAKESPLEIKKPVAKKTASKKAVSKKPEAETGIEFTNPAGKNFSAKYVKSLAETMSQRKAAEILGIGKTTFANWIKKIREGK